MVVLLALAGVLAFVSFRRAAGPGALPGNPNGEAGRAQAPVGPDGESETLTYVNPEPKFSFRYASGFTVSPMEDASGGTILVRDPNGQKQEFQIHISMFDEPGPITAERILKDIPDMVIDAPQTVSVGGASALTFLSQDASLGKTREVWFTQEKYLYQITAYAEMDEVLGKILETWKFG